MKRRSWKIRLISVLSVLVLIICDAGIKVPETTVSAATVKNSNMLSECVPYYLENSTIEENVVMAGVIYNDAIKVSLNSDSHQRRIGFNLAELYTTVSFEVGHIDDTGTANGNIVLSIYRDGEMCDSYDLEVDDIAKKIDCDTTGISQLEIVITYEYYVGEKGYFGIGALNFSGNTDGNAINMCKTSNMSRECTPYYLEETTVENNVVMGGVTYNDALKISLDSDSRSRDIGFNLQNKYTNLSFEIGHIDGTGLANGNINVSIYKDSNLDSSYDLNINDIAKKITCDVSGVSQFELVLTYDYYTGVKGYFGVGALDFQKNGSETANGQIVGSTFLSYCSPYSYNECTLNQTLVMGGITYTNAIKVSLDSDSKKRTIAFNLQEMYKSIEFSIGHIDGTGLANYDVVLSLYGDGTLMNSYELQLNDIPKTISCDTTGVSQFEIIIDYKYVTGIKGYFGIGALKGASFTTIESFEIDHEKIVYMGRDSVINGALRVTDDSQISAEILSNEIDTIEWISSDQRIVQDDQISCIGINSYDNRRAELQVSFIPHNTGEVIITGTTSNGLTARCIVTVRSTSTDEIEFSIDPSTEGTIHSLLEISGYIRIRREGEIDGSLFEDLEREIGNIRWTSSDSSVVTVKSYRVTKISEQGWAEIKISLEPKKRGKATIIGITQSGLEAVGQIEITGAYIVQRVERYTSDDLYAQYDAIKNSNYSMEKQCQKFHELFSNYGFSDAKEGISYLSETTAERYAYLMLTTDECYTASQFLYDLNHTQKGKAMRAALIADGLIFNSEWKTWTDPLSLSASMGEFPGVKKYKEMLYDYMQTQSKKVECADYVKKVTDLTDNVVDVTKAQILHEVNNANDSTKVLDVLRKYGDVLFTSDNNEGTIKYTISENSGFGKFAKAEGYASTGISIASTALEDVMGFIQLDSKLKAYQENKDFLNEVIRSADDLPSEMRYAAYLIREEMEAGVGANIEDLALDIVKIGKLTENSFTEILNGHGISAPGILMNFLGQLDVGVWFSNQIINMGSVVKKEAYVEGYAYLAKHFTKLLQQNKQAFLNNRTEENAWNFYYTYHTLYQIRKKGEESYLAMCNVKGLAAGLAKKSINYELKEKVVNNILGILEERCQFTLPEGMEIPKSVSYHSKFVVQCPVDLEAIDSAGNVVARMSDQIESDVTNSYGRFAVVYMPYTDSYAKIICLNQNSGCSIRAIGTDMGLVNLEMAIKTDNGILNYKINNESVSKGAVIYINLGDIDSEKNELIYHKSESDNPAEIENKILKPVLADQEEAAVSEVRLNEERMELKQGEERILNVSVYPVDAGNQRVRWMSEDTSIAIVKDGKVTARGEGETTIHCISLDNLDVSASCAIKVKSSKEQVTNTAKTSIKDAKVTIKKTSYVYNGKKKQPDVIVQIGSKTLKKGLEYNLTYKDNKKVGTASVMITGTGEYTGEITKTFKIIPKNTVLLKAEAKSKGFIIRWKKQTKSINGYQIQYSTNKKFTKKTTVTNIVKKASITKLNIKKCKAGKKYYIRIRTYKKVKGKKYYSGWSKGKSVAV